MLAYTFPTISLQINIKLYLNNTHSENKLYVIFIGVRAFVFHVIVYLEFDSIVYNNNNNNKLIIFNTGKL